MPFDTPVNFKGLGVSLGNIVVTSPVGYQGIQRNSSNVANIPVTGLCTGSPAALLVSWTGQNGGVSTVVIPSAGTFSTTLNNCPHGVGNLTVSFLDNPNISVAVPSIVIGDGIALLGQSNCSGQSPYMQPYSRSSTGMIGCMLNLNNQWQEVVDPTHSYPLVLSTFKQSAAISSTTAGATSITLSAATGSTLAAGIYIYLSNGTGAVLKCTVASTYIPGNTTVPLVAAITGGPYTLVMWDAYPGNPGGSYWPSFTTGIIQQNNCPVYLIPCAYTGTVLVSNASSTTPNWQRNSSNPTDSTTLYGNALNRIIRAGGCRYIFWDQGEGDVSGLTSTSNYQAALTSLITNMQSDLSGYGPYAPKLWTVKLQYSYALNGITLSVTATTGNSTFTAIANTSGIGTGAAWQVQGAGIPAGSYITGVTGTTVTLNNSSTSTGVVVLNVYGPSQTFEANIQTAQTNLRVSNSLFMPGPDLSSKTVDFVEDPTGGIHFKQVATMQAVGASWVAQANTNGYNS